MQLTCNANPVEIWVVPVFAMDVKKPETIAATARVKAIIRTPAIRGDMPFMVILLNYLFL